jgi:hypothetical protein
MVTGCSSLANVDLVSKEGNPLMSQTHSRIRECGGGSTLKEGSNSSHRVVSTPSHFSGYLPETGDSNDRSLCKEIQSEASYVCITSIGPPVYTGGHNVDGLGREICLRFSLSRIHSTGFRKI